MTRLLKPGEYGIVNGHIFYDINFDSCKNSTELCNHEIRIRLFNSEAIQFISSGKVEIDSKIFETFVDKVNYYGDNYIIIFAIEIRSGVLYVLEVSVGSKDSG